jgi:hypothetical protein
MRITTGALTVNPSSIQGNTITNINMSTNPTAASIYFVGLLSTVGIQNIGDITPNVIGAATGNGAITITVGNGAFATTYEGIDFRGMYGNVNNNICGSWTISGVTGSASAFIITIRPISVTPTVQNGLGSVSGNVVGSLTTPNSIQSAALPFPPVQVQGMFISSVGAGTMNILNNTIANITNLTAHISTHVVGLYHGGSALPSTISGNTIHDLTTASVNTTLTLASVVGIYGVNTAPGEIIRGNTIYNLTNTAPAATVGINGIYLGSGNILCEKNFIHNISLATSCLRHIQEQYDPGRDQS